MTEVKEHSYIPTLKKNLAEGKVDRREFLRTATLLGMSAAAAYAFVGKVTGEHFVPRAKAAMPMGGTLRISSRVPEIKNAHTWSWAYDSDIGRQVVEYLTKTGHDNITRPYLLESWEASDDLKTWTLNVRKGIKWHNGREFTSDDVVWNFNHVLDPATGSSVLGLFKGALLDEYDTGEVDDQGSPKMSTRLWDANAIERVDSHTVRLNMKVPTLATPENMFHYPFPMLDPEENGFLEVGSNGTGAFELVEFNVAKKAVLKARSSYWGEGPYLDTLEFIDLGDDPSAAIAALASKQVHGQYEASIVQLETLKNLPHLKIYRVPTAKTGVARMHQEGPLADPRVRKAMRLAVDGKKVLQLAYRGLGDPGEHHHVSPIHPEYAKLPFMERDVAASKKLLAEAGFPNGFETEIVCKKDPAWELLAVQGLVEQWKDVGVTVNINVKPSAQYWETWTKVPFGFTSWTHRPLGVMVLGLAYRTGVPWNESNYSNPEFDRLLSKAEGILDVDKRREVIREIEKIMQEDGPIVQPMWRSGFTAYDKRVQGYSMHPTSYIFGNELALGS